MAAFEHTAYETLLIEAAVSAAKSVFPNGDIGLNLNRWGSPIFHYDLSPIEVNLRDGKRSIRVNFDRKLTKVTLHWFTDKFEDQEATVKLPKGFADKFIAAFNAQWDGIDPCKAIAKGETQNWYTTPPSNYSDKDSAEYLVAARAKCALAIRLTYGQPGLPVTFTYKGKKVSGKLHGVKTTVRRAPPGGDPSTIHSLQVDADRLRYTISLHNVVSA